MLRIAGDRPLVPAVLLVDDDELVRETVAGILTDHGYQVFKAEHGREALSILSRSAGIEAIVLDIMMPEMEGIEALREIRKGWPGIPVIMISGGDRSGWTDALDMASKLGASRTLPKPFTPQQLIAELEAALAGTKPA